MTAPPRPFRVLMIWPRFPESFWSMQATIEAVGRKATLPPLGLITVAALCPPHWEIRLIDEAVEPISDEAILEAELVMISAMIIQREAVDRVLARCRQLGRTTVIGGPYASSHTQDLLKKADHVVCGEVDECFLDIAAALESGKAEPLYAITDKPDVTMLPPPRFDLLKMDAYAAMSVQFSRGCPFQCEFCDIIVLYGRKPRTKSPGQLLAELDRMRALGWKGEVFLVDDNFIGNQVKARELLSELEHWQQRHDFPLAFYTEASVNLAQRVELIEQMVRANFHYVFLGIETPSAESLQETRKLQNLKGSLVDAVHTILDHGLWVMGGFIVGFDADDESIFERQREFIELAAIPWAMVGMLQAPPKTALFQRLEQEGRLLPDGTGDNLSLPNFRTLIPRKRMVEQYCWLIDRLYSPQAYFERALRSLRLWRTHKPQVPPKRPLKFSLQGFFGGLWALGVKAPFRATFWKSLLELVRMAWNNPTKMHHGFSVLLTGLHMVTYARTVTESYRALEVEDDPVPVPC